MLQESGPRWGGLCHRVATRHELTADEFNTGAECQGDEKRCAGPPAPAWNR